MNIKQSKEVPRDNATVEQRHGRSREDGKPTKTDNAGIQATIQELLVADITLDESVNVRANSIDTDLVEDYAANFDNLPPVSVFVVKEKYVLVDGWHRVHSASRLKRTSISAIIVGTGSIEQARDAGDTANLQHGLPLTRQQKCEVARRLSSRHPKWSRRKLAKFMGVSHPTISAWVSQDKTETGKNLPPSSKEAPSTPQESTSTHEATPPESPDGTPVRATTEPEPVNGEAEPQKSEQKDADPASTVDQARVVDDEIIVFAEKSFIEAAEINAKRSGQPLSETAHQKLTGLRDLLNRILGAAGVA